MLTRAWSWFKLTRHFVAGSEPSLQRFHTHCCQTEANISAGGWNGILTVCPLHYCPSVSFSVVNFLKRVETNIQQSSQTKSNHPWSTSPFVQGWLKEKHKIGINSKNNKDVPQMSCCLAAEAGHVIVSRHIFCCKMLRSRLSKGEDLISVFENWNNEGDFGRLGLRNVLAQQRNGTAGDQKLVVKCVISAILAG